MARILSTSYVHVHVHTRTYCRCLRDVNDILRHIKIRAIWLADAILVCRKKNRGRLMLWFNTKAIRGLLKNLYSLSPPQRNKSVRNVRASDLVILSSVAKRRWRYCARARGRPSSRARSKVSIGENMAPARPVFGVIHEPWSVTSDLRATLHGGAPH